MLIVDLGPKQLSRRLNAPSGLGLRTGPFSFNIRSPLDDVAAGLALHYGRHPVVPTHGHYAFCDFHIEVRRPPGVRRHIRKQIEFSFDGTIPFKPLPGNQGYPMLEWGMNWSISSNAHQFVIVHSAVLERNGQALMMPAPPGSGKSTLCAALAWRGWRLMSDELALIDPNTLQIWPLARPVSLKNQSIDVIRQFEPRAVMNERVEKTIKGSVAHMSPPPGAVELVETPAKLSWLVLPKFLAGSELQWEPLVKADAFMELQKNTFNYHIHRERGFQTLGNLVARATCARVTYSRLDDAVHAFNGLAENGGAQG